MKFRHKPVAIEAIQAREIISRANGGPWNELPVWIRDAYENGTLNILSDRVTLRWGDVYASCLDEDDWIIHNPVGPMVKCSNDELQASYEPVNETPAPPSPPPHNVSPFEKALENVINRYNQECPSSTPDFILAAFLHKVLLAWNAAITQRACWYKPTEPKMEGTCHPALAPHTPPKIC